MGNPILWVQSAIAYAVHWNYCAVDAVLSAIGKVLAAVLVCCTRECTFKNHFVSQIVLSEAWEQYGDACVTFVEIFVSILTLIAGGTHQVRLTF